MKKKMFQSNFAPQQQPGYQTRFKSFDGLMGVKLSGGVGEKNDASIFRESGLREKFKSNQAPETLPSRMLRKRGL